MKKKILFLIVGLLLISSSVFADDVEIDQDGNVTTGIASSGNLEVTGASAEKAVVGLASGTGGTGVEGKNTDYGNYGILGGFYSTDDVGVYGFSSSGYAGYFQGDVHVTGNLTVDGTFPVFTETDPVFSAWDKSTGISITESQISDLTHFTPGNETDPQVGTNTLNYVPKWDGSSLISGSIFDNGNVGIGTTNPNKLLTLYSSNSAVSIMTQHDVNKSSLQFRKRRAGGTRVRDEDGLGALHGMGFDGVSYVKAAYIDFTVDGFTGENDMPARIGFFTAPNGTATPLERMRISSDGNVGIGTTYPDQKLHVKGGSNNYLVYFLNDNDTSGGAFGLYAGGDAYGTGSGSGYGGTFVGTGGSTSGRAYGTRSRASAHGSSDAYGVWSDATIGTTTGREWAFYGIGDGYFSSNVGIGTDNPSETLTVAGTIESTSGGIKFPDGTVQTKAVVNIPAGQQCAGGDSVTGFDQNGNIICSNFVTYAIGDPGPAGGIVFYVYAGGLHGLEAAPADQSSGAEWGCSGTEIAGADGTAAGTGAQNTADILAGCSQSGIAAEIADNYWQNGYDDWFLPSKDELNLLYQQKDVVGGFADGLYWSSTEFSISYAWFQDFYNGSQGLNYKYSTVRVRAVRAF